MTDETKQLFDAPWTGGMRKDRMAEECVVVSDHNFTIAAQVYTKEDANRLARLPELYDALVDLLIHKGCSSAKIDGCPLQGPAWVKCRKCELLPYIELLRKVRDGE